jgi:CheY-like chemotaxis protein
VTVSDTGTGIPEELRERIFDPFFTTKEAGKGTGLGLATVRGIVKNHRGLVTVQSEVGKGSSFKIHLPALEKRSLFDREPQEAPLPTGKGELILVVDDEAAIRQIAKATLENYGYQVLTSTNGVEAVALFKQQPQVKAVVLDSMMPYMDGAATAGALREIDSNVKIVRVSGLSPGEDTSAANALEAFLTKPYSAGQLLAALQRLLHGTA